MDGTERYDESSKQHIKETRQPIPAKTGTVEKYDKEYERNGVSNMFMFFESLQEKTACCGNGSKNRCGLGASNSQPGGYECPRAKRITLVVDNLNTHTGASLYKAFAPDEARRILVKLEIHYMPKHGK